VSDIANIALFPPFIVQRAAETRLGGQHSCIQMPTGADVTCAAALLNIKEIKLRHQRQTDRRMVQTPEGPCRAELFAAVLEFNKAREATNLIRCKGRTASLPH
jgi:hypothetical protein